MTQPHHEDPLGYRSAPAGGPRVRTDVVDVYVFQRSPRPPEPLYTGDRARRTRGMEAPGLGAELLRPAYFLQVLRVEAPLARTWHPVMGHVEPGETAVAAALREIEEELGLSRADPALLGLWALEQVHPFYIAAIDSIVMSPRFCAEVAPGWSPVLNAEHGDHRWVHQSDLSETFMWPGQRATCREILESLLAEGSLSESHLRIAP